MSSTFSRWRKVELLDLAEKLKIADVANNVRKNELITLIEEHLALLGEPLDIDVEYPELKSFYHSMIKEESVSDSETESQEDDINNDLPLDSVIDVVLNPESEEYGDNLDFENQTDTQTESETDNENGSEAEFRFDFQNYLYDIKDNVVSVNDAVQDFLSTTRTIETIFGAIELYYITKPLIASQNRELSLSALLTWVLVSFMLPSVFGYYINFCRYDFTIRVDPMIYYLTKSLLSLTILNLNLPLPAFLAELPYFKYIQSGLYSWQTSLGQLPLIFSVVGVILTLYII